MANCAVTGFCSDCWKWIQFSIEFEASPVITEDAEKDSLFDVFKDDNRCQKNDRR